MKRALSLLASASFLSLLAVSLSAQPPDTTINSPIPPLKPPAVRRAPPARSTAGKAAPAPQVQRAPYPNADDANVDAPTGDYEVLRRQIWNSADMLQARNAVMDYSRRSVRVGERDGRLFLERLSKLSPTEMQDWLDRYKQHQQRLAQAMEAQDNARQMRVEHALDRLQETQQAFDNLSAGQSSAADTVQTQLQSRDELAVQLLEAIRGSRGSLILAGPQFTYDPFAPTFDPASPDAYTRRAAAASLPGNLARGDALNFIRGDVNPDTGVATGVVGVGTVTIGPPGLSGGGPAAGNLGAVGPNAVNAPGAFTGGGAGAAGGGGGGGAAGGGGGGGGP